MTESILSAWVRLCFDAGNGRWPMVAACLGDPRRRLWGEPRRFRFLDRLEALRALLAPRPDLRGLIETRLVGEFLLDPDLVPDWGFDWLIESGLFARWLSVVPAAPDRIGRWTALPVLLAGAGGQGALRYFLAGCRPEPGSAPMPEWAMALLDPPAREAVARAADLAGDAPAGGAWHCFPLAAPRTAGVAWSGGSLGLPLAVAWRLLASGETFPSRVAATGSLRADGGIESVAQLAAKCAAARWQGLAHLIYPAANRKPKPGDGPTLHPAADLDEALVAACLAGTAPGGPIRTFARMLDDPQAFTAHCREIPGGWIGWARHTGRLKGLALWIGGDPERLNALARQLERLSDAGRYDHAEQIARMLPAERMIDVPDAVLKGALRWAVARLVLANRLGHVADAAGWSRISAGLLERAGGPDTPEALAARVNAVLVHQGQGRYCFDPRLADDLTPVMAVLEDRFRCQQPLGCRVDRAFGALCGTLAQHYGFCGPAFIEQTEAFIDKARAAFGGGTVADFREDWRRPLHYRCYARLEAGDRTGAQEALLEYLDASGWEAVAARSMALDGFPHAAVARMVADAGPPEAAARYLASAKAVDPVPRRHPWQLWATNMGRIAEGRKDPKTAAEFYRAGLARCLGGRLGPTARVMALLPLAGLNAVGALDAETARQGEAAVREAAAQLDADHFRPVFETDFDGLLEAVRRRPGRLFPFTFR